MAVNRTYECARCEQQWTMRHQNSDDFCKRCPHCGAKANWSPRAPSIKTNRSRAMDIAQKTAEGMGMSNMKDNTRVGESVAMGPREPTTAENEAVMSQTVQAMREAANRSAGTVSPQLAEFLQATKVTLADPTIQQHNPTTLIGNNVVQLPGAPLQLAKQATALSAKEGNTVTPTGMLHRARKHERNTGDPRVPVSGATMMGRWKP